VQVATGNIENIELTDEVTAEILMAEGYEIQRQKTKKANKVKWAKISGAEVLEETDWAGRYIPIIEVVGDYVNIGGKEYKRSLVRDAKDPQRNYNYWWTHLTEMVALVPKAPYLVTPQEIKGFEPAWNEAHIKNRPYLLFNAQGQRIPKREPPPQVPTGVAQMLQISAGDIQDTIGMYDASFGEKSNERTGIAIQNRASRSDFGTYHFPDNFRRAIIETTRQLIDLIPRIYDTERKIRILGEDGTEGIEEINKTIFLPELGRSIIINDLSAGKYDVVADVRMWGTRRQEALNLMTTTMASAPNVAPLIIDLIFKYQDLPGANEIEQRIKQYMPQLMGAKEPTPPVGGNIPGMPGQ
jgi:hypothetical protein